MMDEDVATLKEQVERYRRLAAVVEDKRARETLLAMIVETDAKVDEIESQHQADPEKPTKRAT